MLSVKCYLKAKRKKHEKALYKQTFSWFCHILFCLVSYISVLIYCKDI